MKSLDEILNRAGWALLIEFCVGQPLSIINNYSTLSNRVNSLLLYQAHAMQKNTGGKSKYRIRLIAASLLNRAPGNVESPVFGGFLE